MAVPVEMRMPAALIHLPSSSTTNKKGFLLVQRLFLFSPSVSKRSSSSSIKMTASVTEDEDAANVSGILCDEASCNGKGWLICDFCRGQKTNVKASNNRLYRRCPSCKAIGYILCPKCKVFKCVTSPNDLDSGDGSETE